MTNKNRFCVIMCGGIGSRLWPASRTQMPKQFIDFLGTGQSLLQITIDRLKGLVPYENIILITNRQYVDIVKQQVPDIADNQILAEPARRNTGPCCAWAAYHIRAINPDAMLMVVPSDNIILKTDEFRESVNKAFDFIEHNDKLLTVGVKPNRPETGYGYIQVDEEIDGDFSTVKTFTEKPDSDLAKVFVDSGEFYWNSGMFYWNVNTIIKALRENAPKVAARFEDGEKLYGTAQEQAFIDEMLPACPASSIAYAVMEKAPNVCMQRVDFGWSDLGTWGAIFDDSPKNREGNVTPRTKTMLFNSSNNVVTAKSGDKLVVAAGLNDYIVADSDDALLIVPRADEQKIRNIVNELKTKYGDKYL